MSIVLPQELKTQKTNSLPDDLKKIAEELIASKFDVKEEVIPERDDFFLDQFGPSPFRDEPNVHNRRGRDIGFIQVREEPWSRLRVAKIEISYPSYENLLRAMREFDMQNIRDRERREFIMHPEFYHFIMRDRDFGMQVRQSDRAFGRMTPEGAKDVTGQIFGCDIIVTPKVRHCILVARF